ncbi:carboxypeptidase A4-like [Phascolarctos cinereus]|uniref:Carboxypeptidase A4-like n=1 Tax=Phascolarctos cinereus TaxID=38626 RepID=A0A6P5LIR4_PHACI|nr:carboxypeptidase A4-like [Phascolarctos cinereus]XP_020858053.1 carboxypeptidase A4-like [Phascolarctos cinereus]XP_020858054.1 carboxypeptidase A4-like [Phascolarctos cinereus]
MRWIVFFGALIGSIYCKGKFSGHQVFQIKVWDVNQIRKLKELVNTKNSKLNFWKVPATTERSVDVVVPPASLKLVKSFLESHGLEYSVSIKNLQALFDAEVKEMKNNTGRERNNGNFNYGAYHSLEKIYQEMGRIASENPQRVHWLQIGLSFEKRPLYVLKFSTGEGKRPAIWLNAGIHSREWVTQATAIWIARKIVSDFGIEPNITSILDEMDIFLMPVANPDGYVYSQTKDRLWRKTRSTTPGSHCVGVDPNRNWDAGFYGKGSSDDPCSDLYRGPKPHSEVEVKSVMDFIKSHGNFKSFIDIHSYSQLLMFPYGYTCTKARDFDELYKVGKEAAKALKSFFGTKYKVGAICPTVYQASGSGVDWAYENGIKYAFTFELRDTGLYGFFLPARQILPTAQETWLALKVIMKHVKDHPY